MSLDPLLSYSPPARRGIAALKLALAVGISLLVIPVADGFGYYAMPIYSLSPPDGATLSLSPSSGSTPIRIGSEPPSYYRMTPNTLTVEVRKDTTLGQDGTLSNDPPGSVEGDYLVPSDDSPGYYNAAFHHWRDGYSQPGTYYYQFSGYTYGGYFVASPIYHFNYVPLGAVPPAASPIPSPSPSPPAGLAMSEGDAVSYLRDLVRRKTHHRVSSLSTRCTRTSGHSFSCTARFRAGRRKYVGLFRVDLFRGSGGDVYWTGTFTGRRAGGGHVKWSV